MARVSPWQSFTPPTIVIYEVYKILNRERGRDVALVAAIVYVTAPSCHAKLIASNADVKNLPGVIYLHPKG